MPKSAAAPSLGDFLSRHWLTWVLIALAWCIVGAVYFKAPTPEEFAATEAEAAQIAEQFEADFGLAPGSAYVPSSATWVGDVHLRIGSETYEALVMDKCLYYRIPGFGNTLEQVNQPLRADGKPYCRR